MEFLKIVLFLAAVVVMSVYGQCKWNFPKNVPELSCNFKSLQSKEIEIITENNIEKIQINCDSETYSDFPDKVFEKMHKLEELSLTACRLHGLQSEDFSGMHKIRKLKISTMNAQQSLDLKFDTFASLKNLQMLDLSSNNIRELNENFLCTISGLKALNLTDNRLKSVKIFDSDCSESSELELLDLSSNDLHSVPQFRRNTNLNLQQVYLQHNNIKYLESEVFNGLGNLKVLNISNNLLETIAVQIFSHTNSIEEIHLQNNQLYDLPTGLFNGLEHLLILDLSDNQLTSHHVDNTTFSGLIRLVVLNMANNALTRISSNTFKDLNFLQILDLSNNSIGLIEPGTFLPLFNLHTLNLAENRLHIIDNIIFNGLHVLSKLSLNNNLITAIETQAFSNCSDLKELALASNQLTEVPFAVQDLKMLRTLDLGENQITDIANGTFINLENLTGLRLIDNHLVNITGGMFSNLPNLKVLNLAKNRIRHIHHQAFDDNIKIEAIRLDKNFLINVDGLFARLNTLLWLNLSENHLEWFDFAFIPENLKWLDIHSNYIPMLQNYYKLQEQMSLTTLDASYNRITELGPMSIPNTIELLFINNNMITTIAANTFVNKVHLARVDLYANLLSKIQLNSLRVAPVLHGASTPDFYLAGNPLECDCTMDWLLHINNATVGVPQIMDFESVECLMPFSRNAPVRPLASLKTSDFICKYESHCPTTCHCCDIADCDCEMVCPNNCSCYHDSAWSTNIVDCGKQNLQALPAKIPADVTDLYLDGNNLQHIQSTDFDFATNLRSLYLNSSNVATIANQSFAKLHRLERLHLENNAIGKMEAYDFLFLSSLKELYLHHNHITDVAFTDALRHPYASYDHITLGRNSWSCSCENLEMLLAFIAQNKEAVADYTDIYCNDVNGIKYNLSASDEVTLLQKCIGAGASGNNQTDNTEYMPILALVVLLIVLVIVLIIGFLFRESVKMCLLSRYTARPCSGGSATATKYSETDTGKLYDAIVLHSTDDYNFVLHNVATELEQLGRPALKLCIPQRDMQHQEQQPRQLSEMVKQSTKVILVLTKNFLQQEWSREDYRIQFHELLRADGNASKLVIMEESDVTADAEFNSELMPYLKLVPSIRILTSDQYFWQKVRYALPIHPKCSRPGNQYTIDFMHHPPMHHEEYKHSSSLYYEDEMDGNYSSGGSMGTNPKSLLGRQQPNRTNEMLLRPPSEHIYTSIGSDYHAYDYTDRFSMMPNGSQAAMPQQV